MNEGTSPPEKDTNEESMEALRTMLSEFPSCWFSLKAHSREPKKRANLCIQILAWHTFSVKDQRISILDFMGPHSPCDEAHHRQFINEWAWPCSRKALCVHTIMIYFLYVTRESFFFPPFFNPLKVWKPVLAHGPNQNRWLVWFSPWAAASYPLLSSLTLVASLVPSL